MDNTAKDNYEREYAFELKFLKDNGVENTSLNTNDGEMTLAEILSNFGADYYSEHYQGEYGRPDY